MDKLKETQISKLKHALGLDREKFSYRNYYCTYEENDELEEMVDLGIMTVRRTNDAFYYYVSDSGIEMAQTLFGKFEVRHD